MFTRILIPVDFSSCAQLALVTARTHFPQAQRHLLYVAEVAPKQPPSALDLLESGVPGHPAHDLAFTALQRQLEQNETAEQVPGKPADAILNAAEAWSADLVIMGTHGRQGLAHLVYGSVAEAVVRRARVPVMLVRAGHSGS